MCGPAQAGVRSAHKMYRPAQTGVLSSQKVKQPAQISVHKRATQFQV